MTSTPASRTALGERVNARLLPVGTVFTHESNGNTYVVTAVYPAPVDGSYPDSSSGFVMARRCDADGTVTSKRGMRVHPYDMPAPVEAAPRPRLGGSDKAHAMSYPALEGRPVTQGHADYCARRGHATHVDDGVLSPFCPRCGANTAPRDVVPMSEVEDELTLTPAHADYPHNEGTLYDCPACDARCHCAPGATECVYEGTHNGTADEPMRPRAAYAHGVTLAELELDYACDMIATPASGDITAKRLHWRGIARPVISLWGMRSAGGYGVRA